MNSNKRYMDIKEGDVTKNNKRGDILYYSVSQVANLLDQEDNTIRYCTNVFDNILKIEISDKELRYTHKDIDTLEFLINLKNKGMTIKQIQKYCETLPLNIEELVEIKEDNELSIKNVMKVMESAQDKQLNPFREDLLKEIKQYIDYKFDMESKINKDLYNELSIKIDTLISEKLSLEDNIRLQLDRFNDLSISRDRNLIAEIKRFENIIERAYYIQQDMESQKENISFIGKLFRAR